MEPRHAVTFGGTVQVARLMGGELGLAFVVTFVRVRSQTASNLIGLHVASGDPAVSQRLAGYAAAAGRGVDPAGATARGFALLGQSVRVLSTTQAVDSFVVLAVLALAAAIWLVIQRAAPDSPAGPRLPWRRAETSA